MVRDMVTVLESDGKTTIENNHAYNSEIGTSHHPPSSDQALLTVHCKITTHYRREGPLNPTKFYVEGNERKAKNAGRWLFFVEKRELHGSRLHTSAEPIFDRVPIIHFG
jgi:hypothetical protein